MGREIKNINNGPIHCACVIHGTMYSWDYVDRLYNMLSRNLSKGIVMHVYTEPSRDVPPHMIKHELEDMGVSGPKKSWWYKLQMFNPEHYSGPLLYFDLDVVITDIIDWIPAQSLNYFWAPRDFKYIWSPRHTGINSSVMWWDTSRFGNIWDQFTQQNLNLLRKHYPGDQDFLSQAIGQDRRRFLDEKMIKSWKWECVDGGWNFKTRDYVNPGSGINTFPASVLVFHGKPKPHECNEQVILQHWK